ncbi:unnamed protein product [Callosobruchus maculatus]
MTMHF